MGHWGCIIRESGSGCSGKKQGGEVWGFFWGGESGTWDSWHGRAFDGDSKTANCIGSK